MNDSSSEQIKYTDLKFAKVHGFFDSNRSITYAIATFFAISLFLMLHFREIHVEILELGTIAPRYLVSQVDFDFNDDEATIILKQDAVRDIGKIYQLDDKEIRQQRDDFLVYHQDWRKQVTPKTFEEIYHGADLLEKALYTLRFTDPRTLQKLNDEKISTETYSIYTPANLEQSVILPGHIWEGLKKKIFASTDLSPESVDFIIDWFQKKQWHFLENIPTQALLSKKLKSRIPDKYTHVSAGSRIIDLGEKVTMRHVAMLQAMQQALKEGRNLWHPLTLLGTSILVFILTAICGGYLAANHPSILKSNRKLMLIVTVIVLIFAISKSTEFFLML
jgi:membrane-associated HD superfamily phosphohydrolase